MCGQLDIFCLDCCSPLFLFAGGGMNSDPFNGPGGFGGNRGGNNDMGNRGGGMGNMGGGNFNDVGCMHVVISMPNL